LFCSSLFVLFILVIVLSLLRFTASHYPFGIFWPLYCLSFYLRLLITPLVSSGHCIVSPSIYGFWLPLWYLLAIVLSLLRFTASDYPFGIFWPLYCLSFYLRLLITPLVSSGHCIVSPSIYASGYLQTFHYKNEDNINIERTQCLPSVKTVPMETTWNQVLALPASINCNTKSGSAEVLTQLTISYDGRFYSF
jgi:hypothetical protein